jgi:hypothetical protein
VLKFIVNVGFRLLVLELLQFEDVRLTLNLLELQAERLRGLSVCLWHLEDAVKYIMLEDLAKFEEENHEVPGLYRRKSGRQ